MEDEEECNTGLTLGLGVGDYVPLRPERQKNKSIVCLDLSFTLCPKEEAVNVDRKAEGSGFKSVEEDEEYAKKFTDQNGGRKKLRLTKEQSTLLEDSFKLHSTLNPAQKQALAERLNLKPRQVEVWFQNRRARTKLKQTEVDCEFLKRCCESLSDENRRLKKELQELRSLKVGRSPFCVHLPKAGTLTTCPSCEKPTRGSEQKKVAVFSVVRANDKLQSGLDGTN